MNIIRMNILTLPDEMLTNLLKYFNFFKLQNLRKINQRINKLAERADLGRRMPVDKLTLDGSCGYSMTLVAQTSLKFEQIYRSLSWKDEAELNKILSRVAVVHTLSLKYMNFDEKFLSIVRKHKNGFRNCKDLSFTNVACEISIEDTKSFLLNICPRVETMMVLVYGATGQEKLLQPELLGCRRWKYLFIHPVFKKEGNGLYDDFLLTVALKCEEFKCYFNRTFTIRAAMELLRRCQLNHRVNHAYNLGYLQLGNTDSTEIESTFKKKFENACVVKKLTTHTTEYKITITNRGKSHILEFKSLRNNLPL